MKSYDHMHTQIWTRQVCEWSNLYSSFSAVIICRCCDSLSVRIDGHTTAYEKPSNSWLETRFTFDIASNVHCSHRLCLCLLYIWDQTNLSSPCVCMQCPYKHTHMCNKLNMEKDKKKKKELRITEKRFLLSRISLYAVWVAGFRHIQCRREAKCGWEAEIEIHFAALNWTINGGTHIALPSAREKTLLFFFVFLFSLKTQFDGGKDTSDNFSSHPLWQ